MKHNQSIRLLYVVLMAALAIIVMVFVSGCSASKKAHGYFSKHPEEFARPCADAFPVKDSVAPPVVKYVPADNKNYKGTIDSIQEAADKLAADIRRAGEESRDSLANDCGRAVTGLQEQAGRLQKQVSDLKGQYKPCKPDTVRIETKVYRENTALVTALRQDLAVTAADRDRNAKEAAEWKGAAKKRFWIIVGLLAAIGIGIYLRIKGIL